MSVAATTYVKRRIWKSRGSQRFPEALAIKPIKFQPRSASIHVAGPSGMVLDANVCYFYWSDTLTNNVNDAKPVLEFLKTRPRNNTRTPTAET